MLLLISLGRSKVLLGPSGNAWVAKGSPPEAPNGPPGGLGTVLGGPLGVLGAAVGAEGRPQRALLENKRLSTIICFIFKTGTSWLSEGLPGDLEGSKVTTMSGRNHETVE